MFDHTVTVYLYIQDGFIGKGNPISNKENCSIWESWRCKLIVGGEAMVVIDESKCAVCGECRLLCPVDAINGWDKIQIDRELCTECYDCVDYCPADAMEVKE
jgi:uncharacterized Fe-S center protein